MIVVQAWLDGSSIELGGDSVKFKQRNALAIDADMTLSSLCVKHNTMTDRPV